MDPSSLSPHARRYQFQLATLFVVTTVVCLHFAVAVYDRTAAVALSVFSVASSLIYVTRTRFGLSPPLAGACAILGLPVYLASVFATLASVDYLNARPVEAPALAHKPHIIYEMTIGGGVVGLFVGFFIAVGYWAVVGIPRLARCLIIERWDKYYVEDDAIPNRTSTPTENPSSGSVPSGSPGSARSESILP